MQTPYGKFKSITNQVCKLACHKNMVRSQHVVKLRGGRRGGDDLYETAEIARIESRCP